MEFHPRMVGGRDELHLITPAVLFLSLISTNLWLQIQIEWMAYLSRLQNQNLKKLTDAGRQWNASSKDALILTMCPFQGEVLFNYLDCLYFPWLIKQSFSVATPKSLIVSPYYEGSKAPEKEKGKGLTPPLLQ